MFDYFPSFDDTLRHMELSLCNSVFSSFRNIRQTFLTVYTFCTICFSGGTHCIPVSSYSFQRPDFYCCPGPPCRMVAGRVGIFEANEKLSLLKFKKNRGKRGRNGVVKKKKKFQLFRVAPGDVPTPSWRQFLYII